MLTVSPEVAERAEQAEQAEPARDLPEGFDHGAERRSPRRVHVLAFRRRVLAALSGFLLSATILGWLPGFRAMWWAAAVDGFVLVVYVMVLVHARNLAARREWDLGRLAPQRSQAWLAPPDEVADQIDGATPPTNQVLDRWALVPFMLACLAGSLLTPFVTVSRWFARTDLAFAKAWADRMAGLQTSLRHRSRRALTVSVAATVGVTGLGSLVNVALAQPASAAVAPAPAPSATNATLTDMVSTPGPVLADADGHYQVIKGDTLWGISKQFYGDGVRWPDIAHANNQIIKNPNLIYPGQSFLVPGASGPAPAASPAAAAPGIGSQQPPQTPTQSPSQIQGEAQGQMEAAPPQLARVPSAPPETPAAGAAPAGSERTLPATRAQHPQAPPIVVPAHPVAPDSPSARSASAGGVSLGDIWACIRLHESGGDYADTSGDGYYGAYQFLPSTWNAAMMAIGLRQYANGRADLAPPAVQDRAAQWLQARSGWGQWPVASRLCGAN